MLNIKCREGMESTANKALCMYVDHECGESKKRGGMERTDGCTVGIVMNPTTNSIVAVHDKPERQIDSR